MAHVIVACVLKTGGDYDAEYVDRLRAGVNRNLKTKHGFLKIPLLHDWPGWWAKMNMFSPAITGDLLYFDLDTMIVGDLTEIARARPLTTLTDFYHPDRIASGMMYLPWFCRAEIWRAWIADPEAHMRKFRGGDGDFLRSIWGQSPERWQDSVPGQVVSYKAHVRGNGVPAKARVVCFHGHPRPREIGWNLDAERLRVA